MELLSPAGNREAFDAAIACGADAVYLGYTAFGARSYAGNFDEDGLRSAVEYAHERNRKVYVTVNTLVKEKELPELKRVLKVLENLHIDAVLVQDLGVVKLILEHYPALALHASTQMTVHNRQGALTLKKLGFSRVVPARECSLNEITEIVSVGIETEVFGHGALCVSVSGQCLLSSMIGGRSGNRGKCAQPCRMLYRVNGGQPGFFLSPRDLMLLDSIPLLVQTGVSSLKIEGRMKRPEYVAAVTLAYRRAIDAAKAGQDFHVDNALREEMQQIFNRGGFTHGYLLGENHAALMNPGHAGHCGIPVGTIVRADGGIAMLAVDRQLHPSDSLQIRLLKDWDFAYCEKEATPGSMVKLRLPDGCKPAAGTKVYRLTDAAQIKRLQDSISCGMQERVPVSGILHAIPGEPALLQLSDSVGHSGFARSEKTVEIAKARPLDLATATDKIGKMGGTPYRLDNLRLIGEGGFLTVSELNALRREAVDALRKDCLQTGSDAIRPPVLLQKTSIPEQKRTLIVSSNQPERAAALLNEGADSFIWRTDTLIPQELEAGLDRCSCDTVAIELPALTFGHSLDDVCQFVQRHRKQIHAIVVNSVGQLGLEWPCEVWGGQGLNVMNSECARFCESFYARMLTASCELNAQELRALVAGGGSFMVQVYGRQQLMLLSHCPLRMEAGDRQSDNSCCRCDATDGKPAVYSDRKNFNFPLQRIRRPEGCLLRLYNSTVTDMSPHWKLISDLQAGFRLDFWDETPDRQNEITASFRQLMRSGNAAHKPDARITCGHLLRGVE